MLDPIPNQIAEHCNQPEPKARTIEDLTVHELSEVATKLAELLPDKTLTWTKDKWLNCTKIESDLADDSNFAFDLISYTYDDNGGAQNYLCKNFEEQARERIIEMLEDTNEMPRGYDLEDYI